MIDQLFHDAMPTLLAALVTGGVGWISWVSRKVNTMQVTLDTIAEALKSIPVVAEAIDDHMREDAAQFARHDERIRALESVQRPRMVM